MKFYLDGNDWEADYFITNREYDHWLPNWWDIKNMYLDSAESAEFPRPNSKYQAAFKCSIPGSDRTTLLENNVIADPYFGRNMDYSRWSENYSWAFRKTFILPENMRNKKRFQLKFLGIDYKARVFFNHQDLCEITGMFIQHEFDVTDFINRDGENFVAIVFDPMPKASPNHTSLITHQPNEYTDYHRSQMSWGWDWMRGMVAAGLWDSLYLSANDEARISDCFFQWDGEKISLEVDTVAQKNAEFDLKISLEPKGFEGEKIEFTEKLNLIHGENHSELSFVYPNPELWYPNGAGKQPLYKLTLEIEGEVTEKTVAFRTLEMRRNPNSADKSYNHTFTINGMEVFARGANWVPAELMLSRLKAEDYDRLVRLAAEANCNLFRVWGGGIIEKEYFYDACDKYGIMIWQEFMHSCSNYRKDAEYVAFKKIEGEAILRKIRNHVSVSMICGGNEMLYYGEIPNSPVYVQYEELTRKFAPKLPFHVTSPNLSIPGERHHGPWSFTAHEFINNHHRQFVSEIGCNAFCEYESIKKFIPEADLDNPNATSWKYHFNPPCRCFDWKIPQEFFNAETTPQKAQASMFAQRDMLANWMNHCRRKFPVTSGCLFWQYNEPWPTLAWSYIDYYTVPKMAYYRLAEVQKNTVLSIKDNDWCCKNGKFEGELYIMSDFDVDDVKSEFKLVTFDGKVLLAKEFNGSYKRGGTKLADLRCELPADLMGNLVIAELTLKKGGEVIFNDSVIYGVPDYKQVFNLEKPNLAITTEIKAENGETLLTVSIRNNGNYSALMLKAELPNVDNRKVFFCNNYIIVNVGETKLVKVKISADVSELKTLKLSAWNMAETIIQL